MVKVHKKTVVAKKALKSVPKKPKIKAKPLKKTKKIAKIKKAPKIVEEENNVDSEEEQSIEETMDFEEPSENSDSDDGDIFTNENSDSESEFDDAENHKKALENLKETDPEFFQYLKDNDKKLLQFSLSDEEDEPDNDDDDEENDEEGVHKPTKNGLEVASDESDFEPDDDEDKPISDSNITLKMIKQWQQDIRTDTSNKTMTNVVMAFNAALKRVQDTENDFKSPFKVDGSAVFNAIIQLCVLELGPAVRHFLGIKKGSKQAPHKCRKFAKVKFILKNYFNDLTKLMGSVTSSHIQNVLLKHLHYMAPLIVSFPNSAKSLLKKLVHLWGSGDESVRVVSFLCILRITHNQQQSYLDSVLKNMYLTYVKNSKFVSTNTLPGINFMQRSLVELFALDLNVSYEHVFLYIRQLAINLRNAITDNKKEHIQIVCNWQFINSLRLWGNLLAITCNKPQLQPLVYPFVQVCLGTIKLVPIAQYYPLRFHVVKILMDLSRNTEVFVPILPFFNEVLSGFDFNKKHLKVSMKPLDFTTALRMGKSQMSENGFKDAIIENLYGLLLEYLADQSASIAFPELVVFLQSNMKLFLKKCKIEKYKRQIKQLLDKIEENVKFINEEREKLSVSLTETTVIDAWERSTKSNGTPLSVYFDSWNKVTNIKKKKMVTKNDEIGEYNLPKLKKHVRRPVDANEKVVLFPSDSEDDEEDASKKNAVKKRGKRAGKNTPKISKGPHRSEDIVDDTEDVVEDINIKDW